MYHHFRERLSTGPRLLVRYANHILIANVCSLFCSEVVYKDLEGYSFALRAAFDRRHEGVARVLIAITSDLVTIQACLSLVASDGNTPMLHFLLGTLQLKGPIDPEVLRLAFETAACRQHYEIVQELLKTKISTEHFTFGVALHWSCLRKNKKLVELLLGNGADPKGPDYSIINGGLAQPKAAVVS